MRSAALLKPFAFVRRFLYGTVINLGSEQIRMGIVTLLAPFFREIKLWPFRGLIPLSTPCHKFFGSK
jgi:hypothetical protein